MSAVCSSMHMGVACNVQYSPLLLLSAMQNELGIGVYHLSDEAGGRVAACTLEMSSSGAPEQVSLGREDAYMVLCSDGIYEFMSNDEIIAIVHEQAQRGAQPATVAKLLV